MSQDCTINMLKSKYHNIAITEFIFFLSLFLLEIRFFATNLQLLIGIRPVNYFNAVYKCFYNNCKHIEKQK